MIKEQEEIAKDICKGCQTRLTPTMKCNKNCCAMAEVVAEYLYNAGYKKVGGGGVVLSAEENSDYIMLKQNYEHAQNVIKDLQSETRKAVCKAMDFMSRLQQARKKTAKEIFNKLIKIAEGEFKGSLPFGVLKAWALEYGVEIEK